MPQQNYLDELTLGFTPLLAIKEASVVYYVTMRPVVRLARRKPIRGNLFVLFTFAILKAQRKLSGKIMRLAPSAPESVRRKNYASADVHVPE